jgi:hypothetical protein
MTHSVVDSVRSLKARSRFFAVLNLAVLPLVVACAGDLDPGLGKGGGSGTATGGATGTGGVTGAGGAGATGTGGTGAGGAGVACDALHTIFIPKCTNAGCHLAGAGSLGGPLDLTTDISAKMAVGAPKSYPCSADMQSNIVNPTKPFSGIMSLVISGDTCGQNTRMPLLGTPLTQAEIDCIKSYYTPQLK